MTVALGTTSIAETLDMLAVLRGLDPVCGGAYNAATVRRDLPDVRLELPSGQEVTAVVRGRRLPLAQVCYWDRDDTDVRIEFRWEQIADALNHDRPLRA